MNTDPPFTPPTPDRGPMSSDAVGPIRLKAAPSATRQSAGDDDRQFHPLQGQEEEVASGSALGIVHGNETSNAVHVHEDVLDTSAAHMARTVTGLVGALGELSSKLSMQRAERSGKRPPEGVPALLRERQTVPVVEDEEEALAGGGSMREHEKALSEQSSTSASVSLHSLHSAQGIPFELKPKSDSTGHILKVRELNQQRISEM